MRTELPVVRAALGAVLLTLAGCSASLPPPEAGPGSPPPAPLPAPPSATDAPPAFVVGSADSVALFPGSPSAVYRYRFRQIEPGSDRFQFQDRELSFYFRPTPGAVHFQLENRQDRPVWIDWERSTFYDPLGNSGKVAHATSRWQERFRAQAPTQIPGLQRYSDYVFPLDYLVDPAGSEDQLHRPLFPEDTSAPQFSDREFGVELVFLIEDRPRTYTFRFRVASVLPR